MNSHPSAAYNLSPQARSIINGLINQGHQIISITEEYIRINSTHKKYELRIIIRANDIVYYIDFERYVDETNDLNTQYLFARSSMPGFSSIDATRSDLHPTDALASQSANTHAEPQLVGTPIQGNRHVGNYCLLANPYGRSNITLGHNSQGLPVYCRFVPENSPELDRFISREGPALLALNAAQESGIQHPQSLLRIIEHTENPEGHLIAFVSENPSTIFSELERFSSLCPNGFPEALAMSLFIQIATAVLYCHHAGVCVRDITPRRIFVFRNNINGEIQPHAVLADLSNAMVVPPSGIITDRSGTPAYVAPEALQHESFNGFAADAWALGVLLHVFLTGRTPWSMSLTPQQLFQAIIGQTPTTFDVLNTRQVSIRTRVIVLRLINRNLEQRLTVADALSIATSINSTLVPTVVISASIAAATAAASSSSDDDDDDDDEDDDDDDEEEYDNDPSCGEYA